MFICNNGLVQIKIFLNNPLSSYCISSLLCVPNGQASE